MQILRAVADSGLYRIDHFQNRPQKNSKPTEAVRRRFTSRREAEGFNIKMAVFLGPVGEARPRLLCWRPCEWITAAGDWVNDRTHGQQFKSRFLKTSAPTSVEGIEAGPCTRRTD